MYRVLIADDDILMREALNIMIAKDSAFKVVHMTGTGHYCIPDRCVLQYLWCMVFQQ